MLMSAEFNLLGRGKNPSFMLHIKPIFGDFSIKKSQYSVFDKTVKPDVDSDSSIEVIDSPVLNGGFFTIQKRKLVGLNSGDIAGLLSGTEVAVRTVFPVKGKAIVKFQWGMRIPSEMKSDGFGYPTAGILFKKIPFLVMDKIEIEHEESNVDSKQAKSNTEAKTNFDVRESCFMVKRQLKTLQSENVLLKRAVDDLRRDISGRFGESNYGKTDRMMNEKKFMEGDLNEESKKALKGASSA